MMPVDVIATMSMQPNRSMLIGRYGMRRSTMRRPSALLTLSERALGGAAHDALLCRLLTACCALDAQRQLAGEYGPSLLMRSIDAPGGRSPMSARKFGKESRHRSQTSIPRPPQSLNRGCFGFRQRCFSSSHVRYSGVDRCGFRLVFLRAAPCFTTVARQPHDFVLPDVNQDDRTKATDPHAHLHSQTTDPSAPRSAVGFTARSAP
jgi:hypothetical protein